MGYLDKIQTIANPEPVQGPGSADPNNWVSALQSGLSPEEIRDQAKRLHDVMVSWQDELQHAEDALRLLDMDGSKQFELHSPLVFRGLSRAKLTRIAEIANRLAAGAAIV
jgi:hypothetical protein